MVPAAASCLQIRSFFVHSSDLIMGILSAVMEIVEGTVIAMHGPLVRVQMGEETLVVASRRRLNWEGGTPAAARLVVGDRVSLEMQGEDGVIIAVHARRNFLLRKAPSKNRAQVLAAECGQRQFSLRRRGEWRGGGGGGGRWGGGRQCLHTL